MSDIAAEASIPIGSVYQFFPDKAAIIHTLAETSMAAVRDTLVRQLRDVYDVNSAVTAASRLVGAYYNYMRDEPVARDIWCSTQCDKVLQKLEVEDSKVNGSLLFDAIKHSVTNKQHDDLSATCFLLMHLAGSAVRLAVTKDKAEGDRLIHQFVIAAELSLKQFTERDKVYRQS